MEPEQTPPRSTVLVVDDEKNIRRTLAMVLGGEGFNVLEAASAEEALELLGGASATPIDVAIVDLMLPRMGGLALIERIRADEAASGALSAAALPILCISGHASAEDAAAAIKAGARDFFEKPLGRERILVSVRNALGASKLARDVASLSALVGTRYEMVGRSAAMQRLYNEIDRVAPTRASVLVLGESGTGKELVSRAIHRLSPRAPGPFVRVNCAAIPKELIESELFGHEKGAFTGALGRKRGLFEQAHAGTLFLDEIGDMDLSAQSKLLRTLQSGEVIRVGSEHVQIVDVRVIAATNKDLQRGVQQGSFREDLFFRLNVFPIRTPPLRERLDDIRSLAELFLVTFCQENGLRPRGFDAAAIASLMRRTWPGNVRELKNAVERAAILASGDVITVADLPEDPHLSPFEDDAGSEEGDGDDRRTPPPGSFGQESGDPGRGPSSQGGGERLTLRDFRERAERRYIIEVLTALDWNISRAAQVLGVERTNLHKKIRAFGIKRGEGA